MTADKRLADVSHIRRDILLLVIGAVVVAFAILFQFAPDIVHLSPQATQETRNGLLLFTPILTAALLAIVYIYLQPISHMGHLLNQGQTPPSNLAQRARTRAFSTPIYLFLALASFSSIIPILTNLYGLILRPGYPIVSYFSHSLLIIVTSIAVALTISSLARRILRPVLIVTFDLAQDTGRRFEIRLRLTIFILSLNFVVFYFLGVLSFNQVYRAASNSTAERFGQWGHDVAQAAPYLDDEALITLITTSEILTQYQTTLTLSDPNGRLILPAAGSTAPQRPGEPLPAPGEVLENGHRFTLMFPIERGDGTWQLIINYTYAPESAPIVAHTLLILFFFGVIVLVLALVTSHYLADDILRDLKYITARLLDIARRGHVGDKVRTLSLDEVGDLITAFDKVRETVTQQQTELNRRVAQMQQLHRASLALASVVDFEHMLDRICQVAQHITASDSVTMYLYNPDDDSFVRASQVGDEAPLGPVDHIRPEGMTRTVLDSGEPILVQDTHNRLFVNNWMVEHDIQSVIAVPVISRTQAMGVLYVNSSHPNAYDDEDLQVLSALASQAAAAIENARLLDETMTNAQALERRARNLWMINRISAALTSSLDPSEIFNITTRNLADLIEVDHCSISVFNKDAAHGTTVAEYPGIGSVGRRVSRADNPAIDQVLSTRKPLAIRDIQQEPQMAPVREALAEMGIRATLITPLIARDEVIGIISLDVLHEPREFSSQDQELCGTIASQAAIAVSNARLLYDLQQHSRAFSRKSQELAQESATLDAVLTNMADGLVVTDLAGRIMVSNPAFHTIAELPNGQSLRGRLLSESFSLATLQDVIADAVADPEQVTVADLELPDGRVLKASASALRMKQESELSQVGQVTGVVTVLRDITHEVEVDRMKTEFISAVSHELRTPLTSILGFASLIQREFRRRIIPYVQENTRAHRAAERILENLSIIQTESQRLTRLINDMLDIAKMEAGRTEWQLNDVKMADVINSSINATAALAQEKDLTIHVAIPSSLPPVRGDQDRLVQVMTNLLSNAIKFTDEGEITVRSGVWNADPSVLPSLTAPDDLQAPALIVSVTDTGVGIKPDDLPLVFERFRQVGDSLTEKPTGTGLGLSICKEIIDHHSGLIWADSELGVGSTFSFALPLSHDQIGESMDLLAPPLIQVHERAAPWSANERLDRTPRPTMEDRAELDPTSTECQQTDSDLILVVDDEPNIRQLLRQELNEAGYQVIEAADGDTALSKARLTLPSLIILDVIMPGTNGFGVIGELRDGPDTDQIPIIILSVVEATDRGLALGAAACLTKPVDVPRLLSTIERLLHSPKSAD